MIQYSADGLMAFYGGYKFRKDKKTGYYLCNKKTDIGKRERLHCYVWRTENGKPIPKGYSVHHIDENKDNNEPDNLQLLTKEEHAKIHANSWSEERFKKQTEILKKKAVPAAVKWHKSEKGHEWHVEHGRKTFGNPPVTEYNCTYCGRLFESRHRYAKNQNTFCSNNCKAAYRRRSGVDDVVRICTICGKEYKANKYTKTSRCESCRNRGNKSDRQG